jgi:hypothetical protein
MKRAIPTIVVAITLAAPLAAQQQSLPRSANGASGEAAKGPGAVPVPRYPYAGQWNGTIAFDDAKAPVNVAMAFKVADGDRQSYSGETTIDGRHQTHMRISAAPASDALPKTLDGTVMRRSPGGGNAGATSLAEGSAPERDTLAAGDHALLLFHAPSKTMVLCDESHRCIDLASVSWEEAAADGTRYAYVGKLVSADTIEGTVTVTKGDKADTADKTKTGTFKLSRGK